MELENRELLTIIGGASITGTFISAIVRGINSILDLGRSLGTAIRRVKSGCMCSL